MKAYRLFRAVPLPRLAACTLALGLLAGCAAPAGKGALPASPAGQGGYIEEQLALPEEILYPILLDFDEAGQPELLACEEVSLAWYRREGGAFIRSQPAWAEKLDEQLQPSCAVKAADGKTWLLCGDYSRYQQEQAVILHLFEADEASGKLREVALEDCGEPCQSPGELLLLADGSLLIESFPAGILHYSPQGALLQSYPVNHSGFAALGESLFLAPYYGDTLTELDLQSADEKGQRPYPQDSSTVLFTEGEALYGANSSGLFLAGAQAYELLLDGGRFCMSSQNFALSRAAKWGESFAILYTDRRDYTPALFLYTFDPQAQAASRTLRVQSLYDFELVREAAGKLQRRDRSLAVEVQALLGEDAGGTVTDAIKTMNTELLAGRGADLYILDGMPLQSLSEKGVLLDLSELVDAHTVSGEWLPNIAQSLRGEAGLYALPVKFGIPILWGESGLLAAGRSLESLADYLQENPGLPLCYAMHPKNLIQRFFPVCAPAFMTADAGMDEERFAGFLEALGILAATAPGSEYQEQGAGLDGSMEVPAYYERRCRAIAQEVLSDRLLGIDMSASAGIGEEGDFIPLPGQAQGVFIPHILVGINAKSGHIEDAKTLLELMLEEGIQTIDYTDYEGLPVNAQALEKLILKGEESDILLTVGYGLGEDDLVLIRVDSYPTPAMQERFIALCREAKTPSLTDPVLLEMVMDETAPFFAGTQSAGQAAAAVSARTQAYLSE